MDISGSDNMRSIHESLQEKRKRAWRPLYKGYALLVAESVLTAYGIISGDASLAAVGGALYGVTATGALTLSLSVDGDLKNSNYSFPSSA